MKKSIKNLMYVAIISTTSFAFLACSEELEDAPKTETNDTSNEEVVTGQVEEVDSTVQCNQEVDLGLPSGTIWAGWNVGASAPEELGNYYAWGETKIKEDYTLETYMHFSKKDSSYLDIEICDIDTTYLSVDTTYLKFDTTYLSDNTCTIDTCIIDTCIITDTVLTYSLKPEYNVALQEWQENWAIPTKADFEELIAVCTWHWIKYKGANGYKIVGPNGNAIFLPAAGYRSGKSLLDSGDGGNYWTISKPDTSDYIAWGFGFSEQHYDISESCYRIAGHSIRPVKQIITTE